MEKSSQATRVPVWRTLAGAVFLVAYFLLFTWDGLRAPFFPDEMMNMAGHWRLLPWERVYSNFLLWRDYYRPMGALFYVPVFEIFGLNPVPFHAVLLALLLLLVALVYGLARSLGAGRTEAWLAAWIVSYHAGLQNLYYQSQFIYDVLCAIFYAGALLCYVRIRSQTRIRAGVAAAFFVLLLCALNSKEMAATLPVTLFSYEWLYRKRGDRRFAIPAASVAMTAVYVYGRVLHGLARQQGYEIVFSWQRFAAFQRRQYQAMFLQPGHHGFAAIAAAWLLVTYLAWRKRRPLLRFCWIWILLTPLPIEFAEGRGGATLAIPLIGWAVLAAVTTCGLARRFGRALAGEPGIGKLSQDARTALGMAVLMAAWATVNWHMYRHYVRPVMSATGAPTAEVIREFRRLRPVAGPHRMVVFRNDPFTDWDMAFIAELWFHDRTVTIRLDRKTPLTPPELKRADCVFDWREGRLILAGNSPNCVHH